MQPSVPPNLKLGLSKFDCPRFFILGLLEFKTWGCQICLNEPSNFSNIILEEDAANVLKQNEEKPYWVISSVIEDIKLSLGLSLSLSLLYAGLKLSSSQLAAWAFSRSLGQHPSLTCWFGFLFQMTEMEKGPSSSFYFYLFKIFFISLFPVAFAPLNTYASLFFLV